MMRFDRFTERAQEAAQRAAEIIQRYGHNQIDTEHILLALIEQPGGVIPQILEKLSVSPEALTERLDATLRASPKANIFGGGAGQIFITPRVKRWETMLNAVSVSYGPLELSLRIGEDWRGYIPSKKRYFYGLRIHILVTEQGEPVEFFLMPGAFSDTSALALYNFDLPEHSWITGDKAYNDYTIEDLMREAGLEQSPQPLQWWGSSCSRPLEYGPERWAGWAAHRCMAAAVCRSR